MPIRVHLGCGPVYKEGWINIDLARPGRKLDVAWDLRWGLPFEDSSVDAIFSEHLLEHLTWTEGLALLGHCFNALRPGARVRVGVPDLGRYVASYLGRDPLIEACRPGRPTPAMALNEVYYCHGHRYMYDTETLTAFLAEAGFVQIEASRFGCGALGEADTASRAAETLYVEAMRPIIVASHRLAIQHV
jgi:predicted SAM-dependent methyltransferase